MANEFIDILGLDRFKQLNDVAIDAKIQTKQDAIADLSEIRSGAAAGATAVQPAALDLLEEEIKTGNVITLGPTKTGTLTEEQVAKLPNLKFIKWNYDSSGGAYYFVLVYISSNRLGFRHFDIDANRWATMHVLRIDLTTNQYTFSTYQHELASKGQLDYAVGQKQDTLISGTNIKTINGNSVLGEGNLTIDTVTETRVQEMIDASINSAIGGKY